MKNSDVPHTSNLQSGMDWVSACLVSLARSSNVQIDEFKWEAESSGNEKVHYLVVIGKKKKMLKVFSAWELRDCQSNPTLQDELKARLIKILEFLRLPASKTKCR